MTQPLQANPTLLLHASTGMLSLAQVLPVNKRLLFVLADKSLLRVEQQTPPLPPVPSLTNRGRVAGERCDEIIPSAEHISHPQHTTDLENSSGTWLEIFLAVLGRN